LDVFDLHSRYLRRKDRRAVREAVEQHALLVATEDKLLELKVVFEIERALRGMGCDLGHPGLIVGGKIFEAAIGSRSISVYYQRSPLPLSKKSHYADIQDAHGFAGKGGMIPDLVLEIRDGTRTDARWIMVEVKGVQSKVHEHARRAIRDLLAYRRTFEPAFGGQSSPYGLAVAWGSEVQPSVAAEIAVCSPDTIEVALRALLGDGTPAEQG
jgi:hypothetical protein